jgi:hypothetical protein
MLPIILIFCAWFGGLILFAAWLSLLSLCKCAARPLPRIPRIQRFDFPPLSRNSRIHHS